MVILGWVSILFILLRQNNNNINNLLINIQKTKQTKYYRILSIHRLILGFINNNLT